MFRVKPFFLLTIALLFLLLFQLGQPMLAYAQENLCDPNLEQQASDPFGYHLRGKPPDRCEGKYIQEVAGTTLLVASLTESFEEYDLKSGEGLIVEWTAPKNERVRLRAQGLRPRLFYRMDTVSAPGSDSYRWSPDILAALNILRRDIGVVGWTEHLVGQNKQDVYVPLRIRQKENAIPFTTYQVILLPGLELTEVFISLARLQPDEKSKHFIMDEEPLGYGYYPAERGVGVEFDVSDLQEPGIYYLEIAVTFRSGGSDTISIWFYHAG